MTIDSIRGLARRWLQDTVEPYRWSDEALKRYIGLAVRELNSRVPSTRYVGGAVTDGTPIPLTDADALALDDRYEEAVTCYATYLAYRDDSPDTANEQLAATYLARSKELMY